MAALSFMSQKLEPSVNRNFHRFCRHCPCRVRSCRDFSRCSSPLLVTRHRHSARRAARAQRSSLFHPVSVYPSLISRADVTLLMLVLPPFATAFDRWGTRCRPLMLNETPLQRIFVCHRSNTWVEKNASSSSSSSGPFPHTV